MNVDESVTKEAFKKSLELVQRCVTPDGFLASLSDNANYRRIWTRDGVIIGLSTLMAGDEDLVSAFGRTLRTIASYQGPHGEIPSNVGINEEDVSYGGTAGRVDASLWFVIGAAEYWLASGDDQFILEMIPVLDKVIFLLGAWEFNNRGFLYIPATGDWADEYIHSGYVLYDQLLYLQALKSYKYIRFRVLEEPGKESSDKINKLLSMIQANFWIDQEDAPTHVFHEVLYQKGQEAIECCQQPYWLPFFTPHGYGYRFDAFANILASLCGAADSTRCETVDRFIENNVVDEKMKLLPAFYPVITDDDKDWKKLNVAFSYDFKNRPYEFHNGGLWPMLTGFYTADLARRNKHEKAQQYLLAIGAANKMKMEKRNWGFPEFVNGKKFTPGGNSNQCWSASAYLMAYYGLQGKSLFSVNNYDFTLQ